MLFLYFEGKQKNHPHNNKKKINQKEFKSSPEEECPIALKIY